MFRISLALCALMITLSLILFTVNVEAGGGAVPGNCEVVAESYSHSHALEVTVSGVLSPRRLSLDTPFGPPLRSLVVNQSNPYLWVFANGKAYRIEQSELIAADFPGNIHYTPAIGGIRYTLTLHVVNAIIAECN